MNRSLPMQLEPFLCRERAHQLAAEVRDAAAAVDNARRAFRDEEEKNPVAYHVERMLAQHTEALDSLAEVLQLAWRVER